ncbi:MAG: polysaccharide deacetylase family protein [Lachnospiraceae bacterium]|nr:polysaccharide deacetylase family protein [Lachnospiraceae bacterium]
MPGRKSKIRMALLAAAAMVWGSGCSRSVLNYQIAECIGTLDKYENNEPVETPKMKAERERQESEAALADQQNKTLEEAAALAQGYQYEEAISLLQNSDVLKEDESAAEAIADYQKQIDSMYEYDGDIGHLSFPNLVVDTERAFDGDEYSPVYRQNMITLEEFNNILNVLYESGYILIDIHSLAAESEAANGDVAMSQQLPVIPQGKKPLILSVENLDYSSVRNGDGVATKLALDENGEVGALYTDEGGHDLVGAYDVVPVVEQFIDEHPDFSFKGARGIISLSGTNGIFGYQVEEGKSTDYESNVQTVKQIAQKLREDGWSFASAGYSYQWMGEMSYETLKEDITKWESVVGSVIGDCDILMYPYGSEVDYSTEKVAFLINQGFRYLVGLWAEGDHLEVNSTYLRQTRRSVTGYVFENYPNNYSTYFSVSAIEDSAR